MLSRTTIDYGFLSCRKMMNANWSNPLSPSFIGLSGELALIRKVNKTTRMELLEQCGVLPYFGNDSEVLKAINMTDLNQCYNAVNLVVVANNFNVKDEFWMYSQTYKYTNITKANLDSSNDQRRIKSIVKDRTNSELDDEIDSYVKLNKRQQVVLITASSFKEKFSVDFDANKTKNGTFYNDGHNATYVPMMRHKGVYKHYADDKVSALCIPLETGNHLLIILPNENSTLENFVANATSKYVHHILDKLQAKNISVKLPRFKSIIHKQLKDFNGTSSVDNKSLKLENVTKSGPVSWSEMFVISSFEINEEGATKTELNVSALELPHFYVHRPFFYFVFSKEHFVLYCGAIRRLNN
ncbi:proteinase inhibitor I4 serpin-like protein [Leptotrombidium deliense]|uniref:Proteinase inhibitor I4 serpin-like protein n=1 Tax=Leptotrombidium deliense TaxID=299467 RepID=A0A443SER8_9ACAR|nr:proteinase inhibitor I4 serpin-like protein [Leptotrombidium deliense]